MSTLESPVVIVICNTSESYGTYLDGTRHIILYMVTSIQMWDTGFSRGGGGAAISQYLIRHLDQTQKPKQNLYTVVPAVPHVVTNNLLAL